MRAIGDLAFLLDEEIWQEKAIEAGDGASLCPPGGDPKSSW